jgi:hypothetical protein
MRLLPLLIAAFAAISLSSCSTLSAGYGVAGTVAERTAQATSDAVTEVVNDVREDDAANGAAP